MARRGDLKKFAENEAKERPIRFKRYDYLFLIVCEDEKTEPAYFRRYENQIPEKTLYLKTVGTGRDPKGVVEKAIDERKKLTEEAKREVDYVWVVFDKDDSDENVQKIKNFEEAFKIANNEGFEVAYSNETFELWLLLHFIEVDKTQAIPREELYNLLKNEFKKINGYADYEYDHKKVNEKTIEIVFNAGNRDQAIQRSKTLLDFHKGKNPIQANPSTRVHLLVNDLLNWIKYYNYSPY